MLRSFRPLALVGLLACCSTAARAAEPSAVTLDTVQVSSRTVEFGATSTVPSREDLNRSLEQLGIFIVRRGVSLTGDVNAGGFRRGDLAVVVDGERYHCACPNRMDPPTSLAMPVELASATWDRSSAPATAGLAGQLSLHRRTPGQEGSVRGGIEGNLFGSQEGTATVAVERAGQRLAARWTAGRSYEDGGGSSFGDRYGYRTEDVDYAQADLSWHATAAGWTWRAQGALTRDVPYAYLLMDERLNEMWNASLARGAFKVYANRARHLMDNGLRASAMGMSTAADQVTVGAAGAVLGMELESFARTWNANNTIATAMARVENRMMPRYRQWSASAGRTAQAGPVRWHARAGLTRASIGDRSRLSLYRALDAGAEGEAWFVPFAAGAGRQWNHAGGSGAGVSAELASEAPSAEQLFITVRRPMMMGTKKPDWTGAPSLSAPVRATLRGEALSRLARVELSGSYVKDYVMPVARRVSGNAHMTYENSDVALAGTRADGRWGVFEWNAAYTLGWNLDGDRPLSEIAPFVADLSARPRLSGTTRALIRIESAAAQARLDSSLGESRSPAWGRLDVGIDWTPDARTRVALEVINVTDALYSDHLSFTRDPFAAGLRVQEPGRSVRAVLTWGD